MNILKDQSGHGYVFSLGEIVAFFLALIVTLAACGGFTYSMFRWAFKPLMKLFGG